jgi:hypothetical protein
MKNINPTHISQAAAKHRNVARKIGLDIGRFHGAWHCIFRGRIDARAHVTPTDAWRTAALIATQELVKRRQLR